MAPRFPVHYGAVAKARFTADGGDPLSLLVEEPAKTPLGGLMRSSAAAPTPPVVVAKLKSY